MAIDFIPNMREYNGLHPFRFWCQKVLPLVYDDSLSYYELLCKVVHYINNLIEDGQKMGKNISDLLTAFSELQEYVNNYFDTLDFQNMVNEKLDEMTNEGILTNLLLAALGQPVVVQNIEANPVDAMMGLKQTTTENVFVVDNDNYYGYNNNGNYQKIINESGDYDEVFTILRDDGTRVQPPRLTDTNVANGYDYSPYILACSWLDRNIIYPTDSGERNTIWNDTIATEPGQMVCSDYVTALLRGLYYEGSNLNKLRKGAMVNVNGIYPENAYSQRHISWPDNLWGQNAADGSKFRRSYRARELAYWFAQNKRLFLPSENLLNIMPGDVLFSGSIDSSQSTANYYLGIGHCAIVLANYPDMGCAIVTECGTVSSLFYYNNLDGSATRPTPGTICFSTINTTRAQEIIPTIRAIGRPNWPGIIPIFNELEHSSESADNYGTYESPIVITTANPTVRVASTGNLLSLSIKKRTPIIVRAKYDMWLASPQINPDSSGSSEYDILSVDIKVRAAKRESGTTNYKTIGMTRFNRSLSSQFNPSGFIEIPCCIAEDFDRLDLMFHYTGSTQNLKYQLVVDNVQFIELK